jgi:enhancing lycopene biosynthesis protein 2
MQFGFNRQQMGSWLARLAQSYHPYIVDLEEYDAVILGAGFGAIATLIRFVVLGNPFCIWH